MFHEEHSGFTLAARKKSPLQIMYNRPTYQAEDDATVAAFIEQYPFALLTGVDAQGSPVATQLPLFLQQRGNKKLLRGHMMKHMDHQVAFEQNEKALAVFTGPWSYVSARWYTNPSRVSTVNYMSAHVHGSLRFLGEDALAEILQLTTLYFENQNTSSPTVFDQLPADYTQGMMPSIIAFEIEVSEIKAVFKLSQDQDEENYDQIMAQLNKKGAAAREIAREMENRKRILFKKSK